MLVPTPQLVVHVDVKGPDDEAGAAFAALCRKGCDPLRGGGVDDALRDQEKVRVRKDPAESLHPRQTKVAELRKCELGRTFGEKRPVREDGQGPGSQALQAGMHPFPDGRKVVSSAEREICPISSSTSR